MVSHPISFPTLVESCPGYYENRGPALESQEVRELVSSPHLTFQEHKLRWIELADSTGLVAWPQSPHGPLSTWIFTQRPALAGPHGCGKTSEASPADR